MQMMYELIAKEIKSANLENAHPTDYLNFYCLGNREEYQKKSSNGSSHSTASSHHNVVTSEILLAIDVE